MIQFFAVVGIAVCIVVCCGIVGLGIAKLGDAWETLKNYRDVSGYIDEVRDKDARIERWRIMYDEADKKIADLEKEVKMLSLIHISEPTRPY